MHLDKLYARLKKKTTNINIKQLWATKINKATSLWYEWAGVP